MTLGPGGYGEEVEKVKKRKWEKGVKKAIDTIKETRERNAAKKVAEKLGERGSKRGLPKRK